MLDPMTPPKNMKIKYNLEDFQTICSTIVKKQDMVVGNPKRCNIVILEPIDKKPEFLQQDFEIKYVKDKKPELRPLKNLPLSKLKKDLEAALTISE